MTSTEWYNKLDMSTARRRLKSPQLPFGTSAHPTIVTLVNIKVMNGWLTSFLFHVNRPSISWDQAISDSVLETPRLRSWVWSKARSRSRPSILLICFLFSSHQSHPQFLRYSYFEIYPWNIQGQGHEWGQRSRSQYYIQYPIDALPFSFTSIGPTIPDIYGQNSVWPWKNTSEISKKKFAKISVSNRTSQKSNQVITMSRSNFVVIGWVVLTVSCRQANFW